MKRHLSPRALARLFSGQTGAHEADLALEHFDWCAECQRAAAHTIHELKRARALRVEHHPALEAFTTGLLDRCRRVIQRLEARGQWVGLRQLRGAQRVARIQNTSVVRSPQIVEAGLDDAESRLYSDPAKGEELALTALTLVEHLPPDICSKAFASELKARALLAAGNCRRVMADWKGAAAFIGSARDLLPRTDVEPQLEATLLSIEASLHFDTGTLDSALGLIARAEEISSREGNAQMLSRLKVQEAAALLAGLRSHEALRRIEDALADADSQDDKLRLLSICIRTEALLRENRPFEALMSLEDAFPLFRESSVVGRCQREYIEGMVLDALGNARESEKLFIDSASGFTEAELHKNAFIVRLALFEAAFKREAWQKAATICEESLRILRETGATHEQMRQVWRELLILSKTRRVKAVQIMDLRLYLVSNWVYPASVSPLKRQFAPEAAGARQTL